MFHSARLKLTAWYLVIIMAVSFSFSAFIYKAVSLEFQRRLEAIESRLELRRLGFLPPPGEVEFFINDLAATKNKVLIILVYTNLTIFVFSSAAGYFLAGKTLSPIEKAMEDQKRFIADASHEFKTPLTSLKTSIEVALRDKKMTLGEAKNVLHESLEDIQNLTSLSNYLLGLARFQQNSQTIKEKFDIKDIANLSFKKVSPLSQKMNIKINFSCEDVMVSANKESIEKIITILLDNAIKYSKKDGNIDTIIKKENKNLVIKVKDTGIGISEKDLPHIFERFYRADTSRTKENIQGFGLGLSMLKQIVDTYRGSTYVKSKLGQGTAFTVKLPII
jgi:two-component system, OmpR family, sensor histidine kinase CiaH